MGAVPAEGDEQDERHGPQRAVARRPHHRAARATIFKRHVFVSPYHEEDIVALAEMIGVGAGALRLRLPAPRRPRRAARLRRRARRRSARRRCARSCATTCAACSAACRRRVTLAAGLVAPPSRRAIPGGPQSCAAVLDHGLREHPEREALVGRSGRSTYAELDRREPGRERSRDEGCPHR